MPRGRKRGRGRVVSESSEEEHATGDGLVASRESPDLISPEDGTQLNEPQFDESEFSASQVVGHISTRAMLKSQKAFNDLSVDEQDRLVALVMRVFLVNDLAKRPVPTKDIADALGAFKHVKHAVLREAEVRFRDIFGFEITKLPRVEPLATRGGASQRPKSLSKNKPTSLYVLTNKMKSREHEELTQDPHVHDEKGLLMLVLGIIQLSDGKIEQDILFDTLHTFGLREKLTHPTFGNWEALLDQFGKEKYLQKAKDGGKYQYRIGPRAIVEVGKKNIYEFIALMYGSTVDPMVARELEGMEAATVGGSEDEFD